MKTSGASRNITLLVLCASAAMFAGCSCTAVKVPNVVGMAQSAAQAALTSAGLNLGAVTQMYSATAVTGSVISETPAAGSSAAPGSAVALTVSRGPQPATVPNVAGLTRAAACASITGAGFTVGTVLQAYSSIVALGHVISQTPAAGTSVAPGTVVSPTVSQGPEPETVPDLIGLTQTAASAAITGAGLTVGVVTQAYSSTVASGVVISQTPAAGASAVSEAPVALIVSKGPEPVIVPNVVGQPQAAASAAIIGAGLTVGTVTQAFSSTAVPGNVISQSPAAGASAVPGKSVALTVSKGPQPVVVPNVVGQPQAAASDAVTGAGLTVGTVTLAYSSTVPMGDVISQDPAAGASAARGTAVALMVSQGLQVPNVVGQTQAAASAAIRGAGFTVGAVTQAYSATIASGSVVSQTPDGGVSAAPASAVTLVVSKGPQPVIVPNVVGMTQAAASVAVSGVGLAVGAVALAYSAIIDPGGVVSQTPVAGTSVAPGTSVALIVSEGPQPVTVPNVVGMTQAAACTTIVGAGLTLGIVTQAYSSAVATGNVISQTPSGGNSALPNSVVSLVVSRGPQPVTVPDVIGMTQAGAETALTGAGLVLGTVTEQYDATIPAGQVVSQDPAAGTNALPGTAVDLVLSAGPGVGPFIRMVPVPAGVFLMGNSRVGDDATYGMACELPAHGVTLAAYQIGKYELTNRQYCDVLNWALAQGYLKTSSGAAWTGAGDIYAGGNLQLVLSFSSIYCDIQYSDGGFSSKTRAGSSGYAACSMEWHPVVQISWCGAVAFCNWLSQWQGLAPCYDMNAEDWPLTVAPPKAGGYRLPTEAEWERAAAWDGAKHWIYGFTADTFSLLTDNNRCNYVVVDEYENINYANPLGLAAYPYSSPVGWFNGVNISRTWPVKTKNSVSPVGCYDMSGNVWEWCQDWYLDTYYSGGIMTNPTGPAKRPAANSTRVLRGGTAVVDYLFFGYPLLSYLRTAARDNYYETVYADMARDYVGFGTRIARTP